MIGPPVPPGMEQPNDLPRKGMNRGDIASFVAIANHAGQRQIVCAGGTAVFPANDVIDLVREASVFLVDQAVFTAVARATSHFGAERVAEVSGHERGFGAPSPWPF